MQKLRILCHLKVLLRISYREKCINLFVSSLFRRNNCFIKKTYKFLKFLIVSQKSVSVAQRLPLINFLLSFSSTLCSKLF